MSAKLALLCRFTYLAPKIFAHIISISLSKKFQFKFFVAIRMRAMKCNTNINGSHENLKFEFLKFQQIFNVYIYIYLCIKNIIYDIEIYFIQYLNGWELFSWPEVAIEISINKYMVVFDGMSIW